MTERYDPTIPDHRAVAHGIEVGDGIPEMRPISSCLSALQSVGYERVHMEDLAERKDDVPWYYPLEGDIWKAQTVWDYFTVWRMSWSGKFVTQNVVRVLELLRIAPRGTFEVGESLKVAADALVKGGQMKVCFFLLGLLVLGINAWFLLQLFTPMLLVVSRKPSS